MRRSGHAIFVNWSVALGMKVAPINGISDRTVENLGVERRWHAHYGGYYWRNNVGHEGELNAFSPDDSDEELKVRDRRALMLF